VKENGNLTMNKLNHVKKIGIINYGMGNIGSVQNALTFLNSESGIIDSPDDFKKFNAFIMPGVGAFPAAMKNLKKLNLIEELEKYVFNHQIPFLGICLGLQLLAEKSSEVSDSEGLGWINGAVIKFPNNDTHKIPHVGWNKVNFHNNHFFSKNIGSSGHFYFDHSYFLDSQDSSCFASCNYGKSFTVAIQKKNIFAVQFHPEKSQRNGLKILRNFLNYIETV